MFDFFPDKVVEEKVRNGLTNELIYLEHLDIFQECQKKAFEASDKLTPVERRFISELKATSIILPFSQASNTKKHLPKGEMVTLLQLIEVVGYLKEQGYGGCIGCTAFQVEMERDEDKKLSVHSFSDDPARCKGCHLISGLHGDRGLLQKPL